MRKIRKAFLIGTERTVEQDIEFVVDQMLEVTLRAITDDINNSFTAEASLNWLASTFSRMAGYEDPAIKIYREDRLRIILKSLELDSLIDETLRHIWNSPLMNKALTAVMAVRVLNFILRLAAYMHTDGQRKVLLRHAQIIDRQVDLQSDINENDKEEINKYYLLVRQSLSPGQRPR